MGCFDVAEVCELVGSYILQQLGQLFEHHLRELPKSISKRLSELSSNKEIFQKATPIYFEALKKSGFNEPLVFIPKANTSDNTTKKQRKRKIIWFSPPFSLSAKTNIGWTFLKLLKQHFPKSNKLHKIFNKNTVKVRYSCMSNLSSINSSRNKRLLQPRISEYGYNCRTRDSCPLKNKCLTPNLIYRADVENNANKGTKIYFGLAKTSFKVRFANRNKDFNYEQYKKAWNCQNIMVVKRGSNNVYNQMVNC